MLNHLVLAGQRMVKNKKSIQREKKTLKKYCQFDFFPFARVYAWFFKVLYDMTIWCESICDISYNNNLVIIVIYKKLMLCKYLYILLFKQTKKSPKLSNYQKKLFSWFQAAKNSTILQTKNQVKTQVNNNIISETIYILISIYIYY